MPLTGPCGQPGIPVPPGLWSLFQPRLLGLAFRGVTLGCSLRCLAAPRRPAWATSPGETPKMQRGNFQCSIFNSSSRSCLKTRENTIYRTLLDMFATRPIVIRDLFSMTLRVFTVQNHGRQLLRSTGSLETPPCTGDVASCTVHAPLTLGNGTQARLKLTS